MTYIKIATTDFSAVSSVSIENVFSASYQHYLVVRNLLGSVGGASLDVRLRVSGTDSSGADYRRQLVSADSTSVAGVRVTGNTAWVSALGVNEATAIGYDALRISNPFETVRTTAWTDVGYTVTGNITLARQVMAHDLATSYTSLTVLPSSGTITGSITVYGLKGA